MCRPREVGPGVPRIPLKRDRGHADFSLQPAGLARRGATVGKNLKGRVGPRRGADHTAPFANELRMSLHDPLPLDRPAVAGGLRRYLTASAGMACVGLALVGAVLPLVPATPFWLLAAYLLHRSWPAMHERLLSWPYVGRVIRDWQRERGVRRSAKWSATALLGVLIAGTLAAATFGPTAGSVPTWAVALSVGGSLVGLVVVWRLPAARDAAAPRTVALPRGVTVPPGTCGTP